MAAGGKIVAELVALLLPPAIQHLKITDKELVDVNRFEFVIA